MADQATTAPVATAIGDADIVYRMRLELCREAMDPAPETNVTQLTWLVAERGGLEAITDRATDRAISLASDYAILEINGERTGEDFASAVDARRAAAFADYISRSASPKINVPCPCTLIQQDEDRLPLDDLRRL
nr:hypothetical protein [uncultured Rhizobium sp.]